MPTRNKYDLQGRTAEAVRPLLLPEGRRWYKIKRDFDLWRRVYVWGTYGRVLTQDYFNVLCNRYPDHVDNYHDYIQKHWVGRRCSDCVGLIKGYLWYNPNKQEIQYGYGGATDYGANSMYNAASEKGPISNMPEIPGLGVWHSGHVGIYIGNGYVIQAMGTKYGVVKTKLSGSSFTNWFKIPGITYLDN